MVGAEPGLVATGLGHRYSRGPWLFHDLDLALSTDSVYALVGPSGSGKSTLLSILAGWTRPTAGGIARRPGGRAVWVFQNPHGVPARTAVDHVVLPFVVRGVRRRAAQVHAVELLERFGLRDVASSPFAQLSGGEAQRLMLARAVAARPALLLVDEPTAQLDPVAAGVVSVTLRELADEGAVVVVATHDAATRAACQHVIDLAAERAR